jgi:hypothetical protein
MFEKRLNIILISLILVVCIAIGIPLAFSQCEVKTDANATVPTTVVTNASETESLTETNKPSNDIEVVTEKIKINKKAAAAAGMIEKTENKTEPSTPSATEAATENKTSEQKSAKAAKKKAAEKQKATELVPFATAKPVKQKASYDAQWNAGYLVAIDNPDKGYHCPHIELSDDDRELLEKLCYGEFGTGGFTGAALIAQSVKNAMAKLGTTSVKQIIRDCRYTGSTTSGTSEACKKAVIYVFDMDKDAVQHRLLYMYNPTMVQSKFHESQNYICTFKEIRFFD